jgi:hypothetical protein
MRHRLVATISGALLLASLASVPCYAADDAAGSHYIAVVSDADSHPFNWFGQALGEPWRDGPQGSDELTIIPLPVTTNSPTVGTISVSNSWLGPSRAMAATKDGSVIFVADPQQSRAEAGNPKDPQGLKSNHKIRAIDVSDRLAPKVLAEADVFDGPQAVSISHDDKTLVFTGTGSPDGNIGFMSWDGKKFGQPKVFPVKGFAKLRPLQGDRLEAGGAMWSPARDFIGVAVNANAIVFYRVQRGANGDVSDIVPFGEPVGLDKGLFAGLWSPDGRYFLDNETLWPANQAELANCAPTIIQVIRLANPDIPYGKENHHVITNGTPITRSAEGLAISPDGKMVAAVSLGQTWFPKGHKFRTPSTVTLLDFNTEDGILTPVATAHFEGVMPEDIAFTPDGKQLAATAYNYQDDPEHGGVEIFSISRDKSGAHLTHAFTVKVQHGPNSIITH